MPATRTGRPTRDPNPAPEPEPEPEPEPSGASVASAAAEPEPEPSGSGVACAAAEPEPEPVAAASKALFTAWRVGLNHMPLTLRITASCFWFPESAHLLCFRRFCLMTLLRLSLCALPSALSTS